MGVRAVRRRANPCTGRLQPGTRGFLLLQELTNFLLQEIGEENGQVRDEKEEWGKSD